MGADEVGSSGVIRRDAWSATEGGRYDGLMSRFGVEQPAAGFSLYLEPIHKAQLEQNGRATDV